MDELKRLTNKSYTCVDLNCPQYVRIKNRQAWERILKKKAKRKLKNDLRKDLENGDFINDGSETN